MVAPMKVARWDNPVPMTCDAVSSVSPALADQGIDGRCREDATHIHLADDKETVVAFRCARHRLDGVPPADYDGYARVTHDWTNRRRRGRR